MAEPHFSTECIDKVWFVKERQEATERLTRADQLGNQFKTLLPILLFTATKANWLLSRHMGSTNEVQQTEIICPEQSKTTEHYNNSEVYYINQQCDS